MAVRTWKSIVDEAPAVNLSTPRSVEDEPYTTREEYYDYLDRVRKDPFLSPGEKEDIIFGSVEPEETFEEYLDRQTP